MKKSPFKFLDSYTKEDKDIFFGRENEVEEIYHKIFSSKTLLVYGVSGTGKSSIIQCGLANRFEDSDWLPLGIRRGNDLNANFEKALAKIAVTPIEPLLEDKNNGITKAVQSVYLDHFKPIYFIFDQFEELFIFGAKDEKLEFIKTIKAITESDIQCKFIFVIREEYLAGITEFEDYLPKIMLNRIRIEKLSQSRAVEVIDGPCKVAGIEVESGFTNELLDKLSPDGGEVELTYLQVFLDKIYQKASSGTEQIKFSLPMLNDLGNVSDVLGSYLDEQIKKLDDPEAGTTVLKSFVSLKGTKRQITEAEVRETSLSFGKDIPDEKIKDIIQKLISYRILKDKDESGRYELKHDALASKIYEKITLIEKELLEIRQYIENAYSTYLKKKIYLSADSLKYIEPYIDKLYLNKDQAGFVEESRDEIEKAARYKKRLFYTVVSFILILSTAFTIWALSERKKAEMNAEVLKIEKQKSRAMYFNSLSKEILKDDATKSLRIAEHAYSLDTTNQEIYRNIKQIYYSYDFYSPLGNGNYLNLQDISKDGKSFLWSNNIEYSLSTDQNAYITSITGEIETILEKNKFDSISEFNCILVAKFINDCTQIITSTFNKELVIWDRSGNVLKKLSIFDQTESSIQIKTLNDIKRIFIIHGYDFIILNDDGELLKRITTNTQYYSININSDKNIVALSNDKKSAFYNIEGEKIKEFNGRYDVKELILDGMMKNNMSQDIEAANRINTEFSTDEVLVSLNKIYIYDKKGNVKKDIDLNAEDMSARGDYFFDQEKIITPKNNFFDTKYRKYEYFIPVYDSITSLRHSFDSKLVILLTKKGRIIVTDTNFSEVFNAEGIKAEYVKGNRIVCLTRSGLAEIYNTEGKEIKTLSLQNDKYNNILTSSDKSKLALESEKGHITIYDCESDIIIELETMDLLKEKLSQSDLNIKNKRLHLSELSPKGNFLIINSQIKKDGIFKDDGKRYLFSCNGEFIQEFKPLTDKFGDFHSDIWINPEEEVLIYCGKKNVEFFNLQGKLIKSYENKYIWGEVVFTEKKEIIFNSWPLSVFDYEGNLIKEYDERIDITLISKDGRYLIYFNDLSGDMEIYDIAKSKKTDNSQKKQPFTSFDIANQSNLLLTVDIFGNAELMQIDGSKLRSFPNRNSGIKNARFSHDGKFISFLYNDGSASIWSLPPLYEDFKNRNSIYNLSMMDRFELGLVDFSDLESAVLKNDYRFVSDFIVQYVLSKKATDDWKNSEDLKIIIDAGYKIKPDLSFNTISLATSYTRLCYYMVYSGRYKEALDLTIIAQKFDKEKNNFELVIWYSLAYILNDQWKNAEDLIIKSRGKTWDSGIFGEKICFDNKIVDIIDNFKLLGINHPDFEKVRKLLKVDSMNIKINDKTENKNADQ